MLAAGADPNQTSQGGQTPLILAIVSGNLHLVNLLLDAGADPSHRDNTGLNAIEWAERKGLPDVAKVLQNPGRAPGRISAPQTAVKHVQSEVPINAQSTREPSLTSDEKSRKWIAGLKQRLDEKADRERTSEQTEPTPNVVTAAVNPVRVQEPPVVPVPTPIIEEEPPDLPEEPEAILAPTSDTGKKRCPQCNTIYDSPLIAYCAYHVVPLIDVDAPAPPPPPRPLRGGLTPLLWMLVVATFIGASAAAYVAISPLYSRKQEALPAAPPAPPNTSGKAVPVVSGDLSGKALVIPDAYAPAKLTESVTVVVRVKVDKKGLVYSAQATGGDDQLQEVALQSARKSEFSTENLGARGTQGTITYMFKP
jgi:hypothetical protein